MNTFSIKSEYLYIFSACLRRLVMLGLPWLFYGCASSEMVRVPASDSTPPTVSMTVLVEFANGAPTQNILLDENSTAPPVVYLHHIDDAVSVIASGTDADGGIKNIEVISSISTSYIDPNGNGVSGSPAVASTGNPSNAQVGESTSI